MGTRLCETVYHTSLVQTLCLMYAFNTCLYTYLLPHFYKPLIENNSCHIGCNMKQETGLKLGKQYVKAVYCHPAYLTYMQSTSCKMLGWIKHRLESSLPKIFYLRVLYALQLDDDILSLAKDDKLGRALQEDRKSVV